MLFGLTLNVYLFIAVVFLLIFILGHLLERIKVPWIFSALILGAILAFNNPYKSITNSPEFEFIAMLGQYFLLFIIGFEINIKKIRSHGGFIIRSAIIIIGAQAILGALLFHFIFGISIFSALLVALAFATIGEAVLVPILDHFRIVNTPLGQTLIGIGTLDDIVEIIALVTAIAFIGVSAGSGLSFGSIVMTLALLIGLVLLLPRMREEANRFGFSNLEYVFLFTILMFFLFIGVGEFADMAALGALLAGLALGNFIPHKRLETIRGEISSMCYGLFAPLFLFWVGTTLDIHYVLANPVMVILVCVVTTVIAIAASVIASRGTLSAKEGVLLGIGVSVRFSTSTVIFNLLYENKIIPAGLYTVLIASSIVVTFIVPLLFSTLIRRWNVAQHQPTTDIED